MLFCLISSLFTASYKKSFTLGALLLISDLPLSRTTIKTKKGSKFVLKNFMTDPIEKGVKTLLHANGVQERQIKGAYHRNIEL